MNAVIWSLIIIGGIALLLGIGLAVAAKVFAVKKDEREVQIRACLPGANCGGCGFPGCDGFAAAVVKGEAPADGCAVCSADDLRQIGEIMGTPEASVDSYVAGGAASRALPCESTNDLI